MISTTDPFVLKCDDCGKEWKSTKANYQSSKTRARTGKDLCISCRRKGEGNSFFNKHHSQHTRHLISQKQIDSGWAKGSGNPMYRKPLPEETLKEIGRKIRENNSKMTPKERKEKFDSGWATAHLKGKKNVEIYGEEKTKEMRLHQDINQKKGFDAMSDEEWKRWRENNARSVREGGKLRGDNGPMSLVSIARRNNCSIEEARKLTPQYGKPVLEETRRKLSISNLGKIPPKESGRGVSGHIISTGFFFRSSYELSYVIQLTSKGVQYQSAEKIAIPYVFEGRAHIYHPDFIVDRTIVEVKPKNRLKEALIQAKLEAGRAWCEANAYLYAVLTEKDLELLSNSQILELDGHMIRLSYKWRGRLNERQMAKPTA